MNRHVIEPIYPDTTATDEGWLPIIVGATASFSLAAAIVQLVARVLA